MSDITIVPNMPNEKRIVAGLTKILYKKVHESPIHITFGGERLFQNPYDGKYDKFIVGEKSTIYYQSFNINDNYINVCNSNQKYNNNKYIEKIINCNNNKKILIILKNIFHDNSVNTTKLRKLLWKRFIKKYDEEIESEIISLKFKKEDYIVIKEKGLLINPAIISFIKQLNEESCFYYEFFSSSRKKVNLKDEFLTELMRFFKEKDADNTYDEYLDYTANRLMNLDVDEELKRLQKGN